MNKSCTKYYIDFEATQYNHEIISVGCIDEHGKEFYSLVRPHKIARLTKFITKLTGITKEELLAAPSIDEVFEAFYDYIDTSKPVMFLCFGGSDATFAKTTLKYVKSFKAQMALSLIAASLVDVSPVLTTRLNLEKPMSLYKFAEYFESEDEMVHNAMYDAKILKFVCDKSKAASYKSKTNDKKNKDDSSTDETCDKSLASESDEFKPKYKVTVSRDGEFHCFDRYATAVNWLIAEFFKNPDEVTDKTKSRLVNKINKAAKEKKEYCGCTWTVYD